MTAPLSSRILGISAYHADASAAALADEIGRAHV
jgi:hypothetical protein